MRVQLPSAVPISNRKNRMSPWSLGYDAFLAGKTLYANPYPIGTIQHYNWIDGYEDAHEDELDENFSFLGATR